MKNILVALFLLAFCSSFSAFASDFNISDQSYRVLTDSTVHLASGYNATKTVQFYLNNTSTTKSYTKLKCDIKVNSIPDDPFSYSICFGDCILATREDMELQDIMDTLATYPNEINSSNKYYISMPVDIYPHGINGTCSLTIKVYDPIDTTNATTLKLTVIVGTTNVFENTEKFSKIFPSINSGEFSIQNENITPSSKYVVYSYSGEKSDVNASLSSGSAKFNASSLSNGEYFIELYNDEKQIGAHKFIIAK